jgi:hypothetical protein
MLPAFVCVGQSAFEEFHSFAKCAMRERLNGRPFKRGTRELEPAWQTHMIQVKI